MVAEAQKSEGIETEERRMIEAVLDLQTKEVSCTCRRDLKIRYNLSEIIPPRHMQVREIMQPRVDIVAVSVDTPATSILQLVRDQRALAYPHYDLCS